MTNEEILKKAIKKAVKNGFDVLEWFAKNTNLARFDFTAKGQANWLLLDKNEVYLFTLIFSHGFAKPFWGEEGIQDSAYCDEDGNMYWNNASIPKGVKTKPLYPKWQFHLQQQVINDDLIKYLKKGL